MKFSKLPKEKRNQLVLVILGTLVVLAGLGYGLVRSQYQNLTSLADKKVEAGRKLQRMDEFIKHSDRIQAELDDAKKIIADLEGGMAGASDAYAWLITTVRNFRIAYKVDPPQFGPNAVQTDVNLLPKFPYKQATLSVSGTAHYHDLGKFLADFENKFPHIRILNLDLQLNPGSGAAEREKLAFKMDIVALVKSNP